MDENKLGKRKNSENLSRSYERIGLDDFDKNFSNSIDLSCESIGSKVLSVSDEWFAPAKSLLKQEPAQSFPGQFGPNGALYDGWESRRHNLTHDWVIIQLGVSAGLIAGFDIDTTTFNGNEAPKVSVYGLERLDPPPYSENDSAWVEILPVVSLGPSSRHLFKIPETKIGYRYLKLHSIPDGGIARFRVYGHPKPIFPTGIFDLASVLMGARVVFTSDQHYGTVSNLILPGRGPNNMGGGWETKRSRKPNHSDYVIIKLADKGYLDYVEIDTNYFIGNFPQRVEIYATLSEEIVPATNAQWKPILAEEKLGPHQQQYFQFSEPESPFTHVKMVIYPDGGVKRIRVMGSLVPISQRSDINSISSVSKPDVLSQRGSKAQGAGSKPASRLPILPLTRPGFASYGSVIEADSDSRVTPPGLSKKLVNFETATKIWPVAKIERLDPRAEVPILSIFSCREPWKSEVTSNGNHCWTLKGLERHQFSSQTFTPLMIHRAGEDDENRSDLSDGGMYLIVVALDDGNGKPKFESLRAFVGKKSQGISYFANIWHSPLISIKERMDFTSLIYETGEDEKDCELIRFGDGDGELNLTINCEMDLSVQELVGF